MSADNIGSIEYFHSPYGSGWFWAEYSTNAQPEDIHWKGPFETPREAQEDLEANTSYIEYGFSIEWATEDAPSTLPTSRINKKEEDEPSASASDPICGNCRFWHSKLYEVPKQFDRGECKRNAPVPRMGPHPITHPTGSNEGAVWPTTTRQEFCGQHEERE